LPGDVVHLVVDDHWGDRLNAYVSWQRLRGSKSSHRS
jgi:hypothetical protein